MEKKEVSMERNLFIAIVLTGVVVFVMPYILPKQPEPPPAAKQTKTEQPVAAPAAEAPAAAAPVVEAASGPVASEVKAEKAEEVTIETDLYKVKFSNQGAMVRSWILKAYKDSHGQPLELVNQRALPKVPAPFALAFKTQPANDPNQALFQMTRSEDGLGVSFDYSDGRSQIKKAFQFEPKTYLVQISSQVLDRGVLVPHSLVWRGGFGDSTVVNAASVEHAVYYGEASVGSHFWCGMIQTGSCGRGDIQVGKLQNVSGQYYFAGLEDTYFAGLALPSPKATTELTTYADPIPNQAGTDEKRIGAGIGGSGLNDFKAFIGPKDLKILRAVNSNLEFLIDFGTWFVWLSKPLYTGLVWTAAHITNSNYGWAIVLMTVVINMILFPLRFTSMKSSKKMQALQPQIAAINAKYKGMPLKDPRKAEQNAEMMELYKKHGVNPAGGCVPMALQIPFFISYYTVLTVAIEMRGASWLWVPDLTQPETFALRVLPIILIVTQFLQQKMTPNPGMDPAQQRMMLLMPLGLGYVFWFLSSGLVLYYLTSNVVGIVQQLILNRLTAAPAPVAVVAAPAVKKKK